MIFHTNTPRVFHVEAAWKRLFPRRFNVKYTWCVCRVLVTALANQCYLFLDLDITKIIRRPEPETQAHKGSDKNIPCEVQHDKRINYTREWRENNLPVTNKRYVVNQDGSLTIKFVQQYDTGKDFSCHVFSHGGNETASTTIILVGKFLFIFWGFFWFSYQSTEQSFLDFLFSG